MNTQNPYLIGKVSNTFLKTALPIVLIMAVNGTYNLVSAFFLGKYIGSDALTAVTLVFPIQMVLFALVNLCSNGMASILARTIGSQNRDSAQFIFNNTHWLLLLIYVALVSIYMLNGHALLAAITNNNLQLLSLCKEYIIVLIIGFPIMALMGCNIDALRSEGELKLMSGMMLLSALLNIVLDYVFIGQLGMGVQAAAYATILAQSVALIIICIKRIKGDTFLRLPSLTTENFSKNLREIIPLGIGPSLNYVGISLTVGIVNYNIQKWAGVDSNSWVAAHGIVTRVMTFCVIPLIGINIGFQTLLGNNYGAHNIDRSNEIIRFCLRFVFAYCLLIEGLLLILSYVDVGAIFTNDSLVIQHTSKILFIFSLGFFLFGPCMLIAGYFQALGNYKNSILLSVAKSYLFMLPLATVLPYVYGELGIWLAAPVSDALALALTLMILAKNNRSDTYGGLYFSEKGV
jgi:putative MATE family efflux protein